MFIQAILLTVSLVLPYAQSPRLHLVEAQALTESGRNMYAVGKAGEKGCWQVLEKYWGKTPNNFHGQFIQHTKIMDDLLCTKKGDISATVMAYNGKGKRAKRYLAKVRLKAIELKILGV